VIRRAISNTPIEGTVGSADPATFVASAKPAGL
jgi:hypothetical protein